MGYQYLTDYYKRYAPFNQEKTLGLEAKIEIEIGDGEKEKIKGFIDRLSQVSDSRFAVHDYKTSGTLPEQRYLDSDRQLAFYMIAVKERFPEAEEVDLVWHFLKFDREMRSTRSEDQLSALKKETLSLIAEIKKANEESRFPTKVSALCNWCEFQPICPAWKHEFKVRELPRNKYLDDPGVKLVNKYAELSDRKKSLNDELDGELELVKEALFAFSKKEGADVIAGSDYRATLKTYAGVSFPAYDDYRRAELEEKLKGLGLLEKVSRLDAIALSKLIAGGKLSKAQFGEIKAYCEPSETRRIYLKKLYSSSENSNDSGPDSA